jgi:NosR/NirI family transcriptional regulator, nitrous oxide reductase regulator
LVSFVSFVVICFRRVLALRVFVVAFWCGVAVLAADRIYTNPNPQAELKQLFPAAAAFSPLAGEPLHFKAYAADPKTSPATPPIGIAFWTTDLVPQEHGYHGPIHILVGMNMTGVLTGVVVAYDSEPYGYFSVEPPRFAAQFKGKSIRDPFRVGGDVDAVSRASITIGSAARAVRDSSRLVAKQLLPPEALK